MTAPMRHPLTATDLDAIERRARSGQAIRWDVALRLLADFRHQRALNDWLLGGGGAGVPTAPTPPDGQPGVAVATAAGEGRT